MSNEAEQQAENMQRQFANLARVTRAWAVNSRLPQAPRSPQAPRAPRAQAPEWLVLERALRRRRRTSARVRLAGGLALGAAAVAAVLVVRGALQPQPALTYRQVRAVDGQAWLSFSDGSDVVLQPGARGRVVATTAHGALIQVDAGSARFSIRHRPQTEWSVAAGPFTVVVHGTVFDVTWFADSSALQVGLVAGAVTVRGPVAGGAVAVRPGQRLTVLGATGQTRIDRLDEAVPAPRPVLPAPADAEVPPGVAPTVAVPAVPAPARPTGTAVREVSASWAARVASGAFRGVVADAQVLGVERCLALAPAASLAALADAARYARRPELARRALLAERRRFAGTVGAHDAAFLLGRLAEDATGDHRQALRWFDRYLDEAGAARAATYTGEALGRRMLALERLGRAAEARAAAMAYLQSFPGGPHARRAERLARR